MAQYSAWEDTLFRVHQTILAKISEIFADCFRLPNLLRRRRRWREVKGATEMQKMDWMLCSYICMIMWPIVIYEGKYNYP